MARKPRIHYPGACYHVMLRGNGGQDIFKDDTGHTRFLLLLQENVERFSCRIHAFCLRSNHIHLAIQVSDISLSRIMQNICSRYTRNFNRKHGVTGHLFQGRFKALLLDADNYLLELVRYIHLNPVRAAMVELPENHPWEVSSLSHEITRMLNRATRDKGLADRIEQVKLTIKYQ